MFIVRAKGAWSQVKAALSWVTKREAVLLTVLALGHLIAVLAETGGAGLVYMYFSIVMGADQSEKFSWLVDLQAFFGLQSNDQTMGILSILVLGVFVFRTLVLGWLKWFSLTLKMNLQRRIATELFAFYVGSNFLAHQLRKRSEVMNNIWANSSAAITNCTIGLTEIVSATVLVVGFAILLAAAEPYVTSFAVAIISTFFICYWLIVGRKLAAWGQLGVDVTNRMFAIVNEVFPGFKSVKVFRLEGVFVKHFTKAVQEQTSLVRLTAFLQEAPRLILELIVVVAIMAPVSVVFFNGGEAENIIPSLVLFGMAAMRVIPAASRLVNAIQLFKFTQPAMALAQRDYSKIAGGDDARLEFDAGWRVPKFEKLTFDAVAFRYPGQRNRALNDISLEVKKGEFIGFVGRSGSGKTTASDLILTLLSPERGKVFLNGAEIDVAAKDYRGLFAFVPQEPLVLSDTILRNITLCQNDQDIDFIRLNEAIKGSALNTVIDALDAGVHTVIGDGGSRLSGGESQRLNLARALYSDAQVLVLDEPTSGLDALTEKAVTDALNLLRGDRTVIMIAHRLHTLQYCNNIHFFKDGFIEDSGDFESLLSSSSEFKVMVEELKLHRRNSSPIV